MTQSQALDETDAGALGSGHNGFGAYKGGRMAHLFGLIGLRAGTGRPLPLFRDLNAQLSSHVVNKSLQAPWSVIAVVTALQSDLHRRGVRSLVAPSLPAVPFNSAEE